MERKDTRIHLVAELEKLPQSALRDQVIAEAKAGEFHDYKNRKYACGKVAVTHLLTALNALELAERVRAGEFDETADEEDKEMMRKDILANTKSEAEAKAMFKVLGL